MGKKLSELSTDELLKELERRNKPERVKMIPDSMRVYSPLEEKLELYMDELYENGKSHEYWQQYIFDDVLKIFYGSDVFEKIRKLYK